MFSPLFFDAGAHLVFSVFRDTADRFGTGSETTESCPTDCAPRLGLGHRQEHHGHNALLFIRDTLLFTPRTSRPDSCVQAVQYHDGLRQKRRSVPHIYGIVSWTLKTFQGFWVQAQEKKSCSAGFRSIWAKTRS